MTKKKAEEEAEKAKEGIVEDGKRGRRMHVLEGNEIQPTPPQQNQLEIFSQTKEEFEFKAQLPYPNLAACLPPNDNNAIMPFMFIDGLQFRDQMEVFCLMYPATALLKRCAQKLATLVVDSTCMDSSTPTRPLPLISHCYLASI